MNEGVMCHMKLLPSPCGLHCEFYEDTLACPFRTPRELWDADLCQFCTKKISECGFGDRVVRSRKTNDVVGCFGFERKEEGDKNDF